MQNKAIYKLLRFKKSSKNEEKIIKIKNKTRASLSETELLAMGLLNVLNTFLSMS
jgi:hypothetical protein